MIDLYWLVDWKFLLWKEGYRLILSISFISWFDQFNLFHELKYGWIKRWMNSYTSCFDKEVWCIYFISCISFIYWICQSESMHSTYWLDWIGLDWIGLVRLHWIRLDWMNCIFPGFISLNMFIYWPHGLKWTCKSDSQRKLKILFIDCNQIHPVLNWSIENDRSTITTPCHIMLP